MAAMTAAPTNRRDRRRARASYQPAAAARGIGGAVRVTLDTMPSSVTASLAGRRGGTAAPHQHGREDVAVFGADHLGVSSGSKPAPNVSETKKKPRAFPGMLPMLPRMVAVTPSARR